VLGNFYLGEQEGVPRGKCLGKDGGQLESLYEQDQKRSCRAWGRRIKVESKMARNSLGGKGGPECRAGGCAGGRNSGGRKPVKVRAPFAKQRTVRPGYGIVDPERTALLFPTGRRRGTILILQCLWKDWINGGT